MYYRPEGVGGQGAGLPYSWREFESTRGRKNIFVGLPGLLLKILPWVELDNK